jgi:hypothetical protein
MRNIKQLPIMGGLLRQSAPDCRRSFEGQVAALAAGGIALSRQLTIVPPRLHVEQRDPFEPRGGT